MTADAQERLRRRLAFAAIATVVIVLVWPERGYVPIWDGRVYANCLVDAAARGFSLESLRCAGHPSQGWALLLAAPQVLALGDVRLIHLADVVLGLAALACIRAILARVFPARELSGQLDLVTLICAVHPVVLSTLVQVNVDFGVYAFFFMMLAALLYERYGWAVIAGIFLCFSKETGVLVYAVAIGLYAAFRAMEVREAWPARVRRVLPLWPTVIPLVVFVAHVAAWNHTHPQPAIWKHGWQKGTLDGFNFLDLSEPVFRSYAAGLFAIGFMWVVTAIIATDGAVGLAGIARRRPARPVPGADQRLVAYLTVLTAVVTYLLTAFRTWSNLRYFALIYPLLVILAFAALLRLGVRAHVRTATLVALAALFLVATERSVDPVSRLLYGTFSTGERQMYWMTAFTHEFSGPGRDQLVYNLEFTGYHHVQNALFHRLRPTDSTVIATPRLVRWNIWSQLDAASYDRTLHRDGVVVPRYADEADIGAMGNPHDVWFLNFSNHPENDTALENLLRTVYRDADTVQVTARGQLLVAHHLVRREAAVLP